MKHPPCIFCDNESGSQEHLWPDWMYNLVKFAPVNKQEADDPIHFGQDPEQTIDTVCGDCNHGWMSQIEQKNVSRLKPMLLNTPITLDPGGMKDPDRGGGPPGDGRGVHQTPKQQRELLHAPRTCCV